MKLSFDLRFKNINLLQLLAGATQQKPKPMASFRLPATTLTWESHHIIYVDSHNRLPAGDGLT